MVILALELISYTVLFCLIFFVFLAFFFYFRLAKRNTAKRIFIMLSMAFCQTIIFESFVFILERTNLLWMYVIVYSDIFTFGELGLVFFLLFLMVDFITEFLRYIVFKLIRHFNFYIKTVLIVSVIQTILFILLNYALSELDIFGIEILDSSLSSIPTLFYFLYFWIIIALSELIVELLRRSMKIDLV